MPKAKKTKSGSWKVRVLDHEEIIYDENGEPVRRPDGKIKKKQFFRAFTSTDPSPSGKRAVEKQAADWAASRSILISKQTFCLRPQSEGIIYCSGTVMDRLGIVILTE